MATYIYITILFLSLFVVFVLKKSHTHNADFRSKQNQLKKTIARNSKRLAKQKQKIEIASDYQKTIQENNQELFTKIAKMNTSLFEELFSKNKSKSE